MRVLLGIGLAAFVTSDAVAEDRYQVAPMAAVVPPNAPATGTVRPLRYPGLWKADQTTGAVSFCTGSPSWNSLGAPPTQWHCVKLDGS